MSKIHYFQRYSTEENTVTNNTLQLLARIYNYSPAQASKLLSELLGEQIEIGIEIDQQEKGRNSVPDGKIIQRSFKILIESKVDSKVNADQLLRHAQNFAEEAQRFLLLLTKEPIVHGIEEDISKKISSKYPGVKFRNITYKTICQTIEPLFKEYEYEIQELVSDYIEYCNESGLFDQSQYLMRIVPCGDSIGLNLKYSMYFQPSDRGYTPHALIGIYKGKMVQAVLAVDSVFDVNYEDGKLQKKVISGRDTDDYDVRIISMIGEAEKECGYHLEKRHRFFCAKETVKTNFAKKSPGGAMSARNKNVKEIVGEFSSVEDLAKKLSGKTWE